MHVVRFGVGVVAVGVECSPNDFYEFSFVTLEVMIAFRFRESRNRNRMLSMARTWECGVVWGKVAALSDVLPDCDV